jgi:3-(3-hydroxy-phenyl)propionate hydroxylase
VGALAAIELAQRGLTVIVLEARTQISWTSRAICISRRSLEILERAGVAEAFTEKGLPWSKGRTFHRDKLVFQLELPQTTSDRHPPFINLQQFYTEQFLVEALAHLPDPPEVRWGHTVTCVTQSADQVNIEVDGPDGAYKLRADWLIAADGARSAVRASLGLAMKGTSYEGRYLICDIHVEGASWPVERHVWFDAAANPGSTVILHVQPDAVWRIDMQLHDDEDADQALLDENLVPRINAHLQSIGVTASWQLIWKSVYRAHALSLESYRHGRVLFAGDAAHLVPIFGVRGLNSGFDDAHNLTWKLAMVAAGDAPDRLLDSYSIERRQAAAENIANAEKSTWFMSPPTNGFRRMRDAALMLAHEHEWARTLINPRQSSFHLYVGSPVIVGDYDEVGVRPGAPVPNMPFDDHHGDRDRRSLMMALSKGVFTGLIFARYLPAASLDQVARECRALGIEPLILGPDAESIAAAFAAHRYPLYLVRPDEHVAARFSIDRVTQLADAYAIAVGHGAIFAQEATGMHKSSPTEDIYEAIATAIDEADTQGDPNFLERLALGLAHNIGRPERLREIIIQTLKSS